MQSIGPITRHLDALTCEEWRFYFSDSDCILYLDHYIKATRPTTRHKHKAVLYYARIDGRNNTVKEEDVPLPLDVQEEAKNYITSRLTVKRWSEKH